MKGICHTDIEYDRAGLDPLVSHIKKYLRGEEIVPVSKAKNHLSKKNIYFTFSNDLLEQIVDEPKKIKKSYESAVKYGFLGYSIGERNGIFYQRKQDTNLFSETDKLLRLHEKEIRDFMKYSGEMSSLKKIKIVTHNRRGERIVGVYDGNMSVAVFLDFAKY